MFISPVHWENYPYRELVLPERLGNLGFKCVFLNPYRYKNWENTYRLRSYRKREAVKNVTVVDRMCSSKKSFKSFITESNDNCKKIEAYKPDFVYSSDHLMTWKAVKYAKQKKIPFIFDVTDDWSKADTSFSGQLLWKFINRKAIIRHAATIVTTSHKQYEFFKPKHPHVHLIPNAIDMSYAHSTNGFIKKTPGLKVNFIGNIRDWYDFDLLFDVFASLKELELNIYGEGPLYKTIKYKAQKYDNIFVHGSIDYSKVPNLIKESIIGIIPLKNNKLNESTMPIKLLDYWAASKAVVCTPTYEMQKSAGDAVLFANNHKQWQQQIMQLIHNSDLRKKLGEKAFHKAKNTFTYDIVTQKFVRIFDKN